MKLWNWESLKFSNAKVFLKTVLDTNRQTMKSKWNKSNKTSCIFKVSWISWNAKMLTWAHSVILCRVISLMLNQFLIHERLKSPVSILIFNAHMIREDSWETILKILRDSSIRVIRQKSINLRNCSNLILNLSNRSLWISQQLLSQTLRTLSLMNWKIKQED